MGGGVGGGAGRGGERRREKKRRGGGRVKFRADCISTKFPFFPLYFPFPHSKGRRHLLNVL